MDTDKMDKPNVTREGPHESGAAQPPAGAEPFAGEDPAAWLRRYRGRAPLIHLKDFTYDPSARTPGVRPADLSDRSVGRGLLRVPEVLSAAEEAGTEWLIVEDEIRGRDEALASVQASRAYLRALGI